MNPLFSAITSMRRSPYQSLAAILMITITAFVAYSFSLIALGTHVILRYFETRPQIIAFFELSSTAQEINQVAKALQEKSYVTEVKMVSKEEALTQYQSDNKDDPLLLELVTADILPASIEVSGKSIDDLAQIKSDLVSAPGVDEIVYQEDLIDSLNRWTKGLRLAGVITLSVLGVISVLIVLIVLGMKITSKRQAIGIMRIIGATRWYISEPYLFEGALYGCFGSILGWSVMVLALLYATPWLKEFVGAIPIIPVPWQVLAMQLAAGTLGAMLVGSLTGIWAVRRLIRK